MSRNEKILKMAGKKSYGLIAKELGISRNIVSAVIFRSKNPPDKRICSPNSHSPNKNGNPRRGCGVYALQTL